MSARAGGAAFLRHYVDAHPELYLQLLAQVGELTIWLVDGKVIRDHIWIDFTEGGNSNAYEWMPPKQIWIDIESKGEFKQTVTHELAEYIAMAKGKGYETAHSNFANPAEKKIRDNIASFPLVWHGLVKVYRGLLLKSEPDLTTRKRGH